MCVELAFELARVVANSDALPGSTAKTAARSVEEDSERCRGGLCRGSSSGKWRTASDLLAAPFFNTIGACLEGKRAGSIATALRDSGRGKPCRVGQASLADGSRAEVDASQPQDAIRDFFQGQHLFGATQGNRFAGHAEHDARGLVLGHGAAAGLPHCKHPLGAVIAHSRENDAHRVAADVAGGRLEQDIDGRAMPIDRLAGGDADRVVGPNPRDRHVQPAGGQQGVALKDSISVPCFLDADLAGPIKPIGERSRKAGRHVLHDRDARGIGRQGSQHVVQRLGAARGCADADDLVRR